MNDEQSNYPRTIAVTGANLATVQYVRQTNSTRIAELGIYKGYTSLEIAKVLDGKGELHLFDYEDRANGVREELVRAGYQNVRAFGCSYRYLDSYNWALAKLLEANTSPIYDYAFLDGAHTWAVDALTTFLVDRLLVVGGYLDFDDYEWSLAISPSLNPTVFPLTGKMYTTEQVAAKQVKMIVDLVIRRDQRYREVVPNKLFQKIA